MSAVVSARALYIYYTDDTQTLRVGVLRVRAARASHLFAGIVRAGTGGRRGIKKQTEGKKETLIAYQCRTLSSYRDR